MLGRSTPAAAAPHPHRLSGSTSKQGCRVLHGRQSVAAPHVEREQQVLEAQYGWAHDGLQQLLTQCKQAPGDKAAAPAWGRRAGGACLGERRRGAAGARYHTLRV